MGPTRQNHAQPTGTDFNRPRPTPTATDLDARGFGLIALQLLCQGAELARHGQEAKEALGAWAERTPGSGQRGLREMGQGGPRRCRSPMSSRRRSKLEGR